jgi:hypothetical protein
MGLIQGFHSLEKFWKCQQNFKGLEKVLNCYLVSDTLRWDCHEYDWLGMQQNKNDGQDDIVSFRVKF